VGVLGEEATHEIVLIAWQAAEDGWLTSDATALKTKQTGRDEP
jgi:hypothetical protein